MTKTTSNTAPKNASASVAKQCAPSPPKSLATIANPITIPMNVAAPTATTIASPATAVSMNSNPQPSEQSADDSTSEVSDTTRAASLSDQPASEIAAPQTQCALQPASPIDAEPNAIPEAGGSTDQAALFPASTIPLVSDAGSVPAPDPPPTPTLQEVPPAVPLLTAAESKTNAASNPPLVPPSQDLDSTNGIDSHAPIPTQQPASPPSGLSIRATFQFDEVPKSTSPSPASKTNSSHSPITAQRERTSVAGNSLSAFQNAQLNPPLAGGQDSTAPSDFNNQPSPMGSAPNSPQPSSNDPSATSSATASVLSLLPMTGDQQAVAVGPAAPDRPAPPPSAAATNPSESLAPAASPVQLARIIETMGQSEMHIGMRTQAFGSIEVHTVVRDMQVGLAVGSEKGDLRTFLASEMPGLQATMGQQDLRFDHIRFLEPGGTNTTFSGGGNSQSRSSGQGHPFAPGHPVFVAEQANSTPITVTLEGRTGLNVHA
ncbi:MAG: hypothetical protein WB421_20720 [Terriglobales bacterium]